jgi:hypothetical protein
MKRAFPCLVLAASTLVGCTQGHDAWRFFVRHCPADGPVREERLAIHLERIEIPRYYSDLRLASEGFPSHELVRIPARDGALPIYQVGPFGGSPSNRILVVAGVHGNEIASALAAPRILEDARDHPANYEGCEVHLIAPANPVGLSHQSRYNAQGCDINRDFGAFQTPEARAIRAAFDRVSPVLVVALHEGPQDGFYLIATSTTPPSLPKAVIDSLRSTGVVLSTSSFLDTRLRDPGYEHEGRAKTFMKQLIRLQSLGAFAYEHNVGTLTTESPWSSRDLASRVEAHVAVVRAVCAEASRVSDLAPNTVMELASLTLAPRH